MTRLSSSQRASRSGFTLIELMSVMVIILVVVAMTVPLFNTFAESNSIASGAQAIVDQISQARQIAAARNVAIEVRFILQPARLPGPVASYPNVYNAIQIWKTDPTGGASTPAAKLVELPNGMVVAVGSNAPFLSPPLAATATPAPLSGTITYASITRPYLAFEVRPGGLIPSMLDQGLSNSFVTVVPIRYFSKTANDLKGAGRAISNYAVVQLNPFTATAKIYQP